ncbi:hypothetical protein BLNAU_13301 [Blattamonas nauphoetae]|nr:hypothetical protein BLNAU_13301 [Blattamonas nauphoetae]
MDEANAARQNEGGVKPNMKLVLDVEVRTLVDKCLSFDPKERPALQDVLSELGGAESAPSEQAALIVKPSEPLDIHS